jgi:hypothetical protein
MPTLETELAQESKIQNPHIYAKDIGRAVLLGELHQDSTMLAEELLVPTRADFAVPENIDIAYPWLDIIDTTERRYQTKQSPNYRVTFISTLKKKVSEADKKEIKDHDLLALEAAAESPALIYYLAGFPDIYGRSLSMCWWEDEGSATIASKDPRHNAARAMIKHYSRYTFMRHHIYPELKGQDKMKLIDFHTVELGE